MNLLEALRERLQQEPAEVRAHDDYDLAPELGAATFVGVKAAVMHDCVARISGREQHLYLWAPPAYLFGKLASIHAGQTDVRKQQIDRFKSLDMT